MEGTRAKPGNHLVRVIWRRLSDRLRPLPNHGYNGCLMMMMMMMMMMKWVFKHT